MGAFWQVLAEGAAFATFGYWAAPFMLAAACWVAFSTSDPPLRWLSLGLGMLAVIALVSTAAIPIVPSRFLRPLGLVEVLAPALALTGHVLLLAPDGGPRTARVAWAAANLTFMARSVLFSASFV